MANNFHCTRVLSHDNWHMSSDNSNLAQTLLQHTAALHSLYIYHFSTVMTSHPRSTVVLLDTGTPGTSREIYSEDADDGTQLRNDKYIMMQYTNWINSTLSQQ